MITDINQLDFSKKYTYADYLTWRFKERVELIRGRLFKMSPAPNIFHQRVSGHMFRAFSNFLWKKKCEVFAAPFDVRFRKEGEASDKVFDIVQPDICVVCEPKKLERSGCVGAPDLIVEILSKATLKKDLQEKFVLYENNGVGEYWIVHPEDQTIQINRLGKDGKYISSKILTCGEIAESKILKGFKINLNDIF